MFKNAIVYRIGAWERPTAADLDQRLNSGRFVACGATQMQSLGWVEPRGEKHAALLESVAGQLILKLQVESKAVPGGVVKTQLEERLDQAEAETGRRPKGKRAKELKEEIVHELLPRAFPKRSSTWLWLAVEEGWVVVGAASVKKADAAIALLKELMGGKIELAPLQTQSAPATAMARWLADKTAPGGFTVDRECELKQPDSEKSTVRYARHTLEIDEVAEHIKQGKLPTQLAMTFDGRVSFVLAESGAIKKIKLLDDVLEHLDKNDSGFDTDVALTTGELRRLIPALIEALDGEQPRDGSMPQAQPLPEAA